VIEPGWIRRSEIDCDAYYLGPSFLIFGVWNNQDEH
jgi:hypothetical protein